MLDGLSFAASIAGLISLADIVVTKGYKYIKSVKDCEEEVRNLIVEADVLCGVLTRLEKSVRENEEDDENDAERESTPIEFSDWNWLTLPHIEAALENDYVHECQKTLREIKRVLVDFEQKAAKQPENEIGGEVAASKTLKRSVFGRLSRADLKWPLSKSKTMELVERLERHKSTCIMALAAGEMSAILEVLGQQRIINQQLAEIRSEQRKTAETRHKREVGEETKKILEWLSPIDPLQNHQTARSIYQKGTGRWFIDSPEFIHWLKTKNSAIWLYGIPGAGKTILSSLVIEEVFSLQDNGVAFYYCDYKSATSQEPINILGSLAKQLALQEASALARLKDFYTHHHPAGRPSIRPTEQDFGALLQDISKVFAEVTIIIDGLDECGSSPGIDRSELVRILSSLHDEHAGSIRIAIASRQERDIEERFDSFVKVSIAAMSLDLELYVACEVGRRVEARKLKIRDSSLKGEIIETLVHGADGMFQWVKCQLDYLCCLPNDAERRKALKELPPDLPATYVRILERLDRTLSPKTKIYLKRILKWLVLGGPFNSGSVDIVITLPALAQAISVEDEHTRLEKDIIPDEGDIAEWCSSLVRINSKKNTLELSHFTVKEFLLSDKSSIESLIARQYLVDKSTDLTYLAKTCLAYLGLDDFCMDVDFDDDSASEIFECNFPFYCCAAGLFVDYLNIPQLEAQADLQLRRFFTHKAKENFFLWTQYVVPRSHGVLDFGLDLTAGSEVNLTPLHLACELLLKKTTERLLWEGADRNATCEYFGTPLSRLITSDFWGSRHVPVALWETLSLQFADPKCGRGEYELEIIDILLSNGADISKPVRILDGDLSSPLCVALAAGNKNIIWHLLSKGAANSLAETCFGRDYVGLTRVFRHDIDIGEHDPSIVEFWRDFIKHVMDLNPPCMQDPKFFSIMGKAFSEARELGEVEVEMRQQDVIIDQQFVLACRIGNEPAVVRLLAENARIEAVDSGNRSALYRALEEGFWSIAFTLLQAGADLNAPILEMVMSLDGDELYSHGIDTITFVEQMAETDHSDIFAREAPKILNAACKHDRLDIVQLILKHDINVNALVDGLAPIHSLFTAEDYWELEKILDVLLEYGADINLTSDKLDTPLSLALMASNRPKPSLIELLLSHGASINSVLSSGQTVLYEFLSKLNLSQEQMKAACSLLRAMNSDNLETLGGEFLAKFARDGRFEMARCVLISAKEYDIDLEMGFSVHDAAGWGLSHYASCGDHGLGEFLPSLLRISGNNLSSTKDGYSELYLAARDGNDSGLLLALRCTNCSQFIDSVTPSGLTPLHASLRNRHVSATSLLLNYGASLDVLDALGRTPLFNAVDAGSHEAVMRLLRHPDSLPKLMLDRQCLNGLSPLHLAVKRGDLAITRSLIGSGARFDVPDAKGDTVFQSASKSGNALMLKLLTENCPVKESNTAIPLLLNIASAKKLTERVSLLEEVGVCQEFQFAGLGPEFLAPNAIFQNPFGKSLPPSGSRAVLRLPKPQTANPK